MARIISILVFLGIAFTIPLFYYKLITWSIINLNSGWVFTTFFLRFLVIVFFVIALNLTFSFFEKTRKIKFIWVFLIGMLPGFGISFISPIWNTDYGDFSDEMTLESANTLSVASGENYTPKDHRHLVVFFDTNCGHCMNTSAKLGICKSAGMEMEIHAFFIDTKEDVLNFLKNNRGENFDSYLLGDMRFMIEIAGIDMPSVFLLDKDQSTMKHWSGELNYTALDYIMSLEP
ncbi:hypothetical protein K6119_19270 [Paracrocinitomix mangrovi]|uniref:hypothetical protein n=1 Tax=Paracrocinitomix mangrovi TaxID=2862509 RepID=UPI001C8F0E98|nr:hypothetical protein [Paracrocinitomix mangrovi]UKN01867.1 hypothetical protein K6119_19270 [Paracrocinitomix mangrovi]